MAELEPRPDGELELLLSWLLAGGVLLSACVIAVGLGGLLLTHQTGYGTAALDLSRAQPQAIPHTPWQVGAGLRAGKPLAVIAAGLWILVLTPVARVVGSLVLFARQGDRRYVLICAFVLAMLLLGMRLGGE